MLLSAAELQSLVRLEHHQPHQLLGMHPLGGGAGLVVRALIPGAKRVDIAPVHEAKKPTVRLKKVHPCGLFEGVITTVSQVYAYDLAITDAQGQVRRQRDPYSFLPTVGEVDLFLFNQGNARNIYEKLGSHHQLIDGVAGTSFAVWAPNARRVSVVGEFNQWDGHCHMMRSIGTSGVWEIFIPGVMPGALYKFEVLNSHGALVVKTDPHGVYFEKAPKNAAIVWETQNFQWTDDTWLAQRRKWNLFDSPISIYEVHLGSWRKKSESESLGFRDIAEPLAAYVKKMGFTHVEFLPVAEHAYFPSWGYQVTGFYAPTSRYGTPDDFQYLVNALHEAGIGVIVDWVPAHFPSDAWCLAKFDGTALYEHEDPRQGAHQDWGTLIFNFGRNEVKNFLMANALFWCERYHIDGLRVDAVASMLYLDYSRKAGEWVPNKYGGRENLDAVDFLRSVNDIVHTTYPGVLTIAEESTAWPLVTRPPYLGGLGFSIKWNMGWMHDTLKYFQLDPIYRKFHHNDLTFAMLYHHNENFLLPISHDEVVHGKGSLIRKMPGDDWRQFANLRTLLGYQWLFPGKKLLFMGCEIGQRSEWNPDASIDWFLLEMGPYHKGLQAFVADLNRLYIDEPALWQRDYHLDGFFWVDCADHEHSILSFVRQSQDGASMVLVVLNLTPLPRTKYRVGLPKAGFWREILNSDSELYAGSNMGNMGGISSEDYAVQGQPYSGLLTLPPLSVSAFRLERL